MSMRLIDAESLKELFPDNGEGSWTYNATAKAYIDAQPTIQSEQQWIPVTERLPEVKQAVLVTTKNGQRDIRKCIDAGHLTWFYHDVVAWMSLPEPYKGG